MQRAAIVLGLILAFLVLPVLAAQRPSGTDTYTTMPPQTRFVPLAIYVDSGTTPLAAYQIELAAQPGTIKIVGIEGGEHSAFRSTPHYDPAALMNDRIIIAAFSTNQDLPTGRTRVATVHLQFIGDKSPVYEVITMAAANGDGHEIEVTATFK